MDTGDTDSTGLGTQIVSLGDSNGDGLADFLVGSYDEKAFVYLGRVGVDTIPDFVIPNPDTIAYYFGAVVFEVGDVNGDGGIDFGVFATVTENPIEHRIVYLYFGGDVLDAEPDLVLDGPANYDSWFGFNGVCIGDFNGDGGNDFVILDPAYLVSYPDDFKGRAYVYYGGEALDSIPDWQIQGGGQYQKVGLDAAALGDVNEDGYDDFVIVDPRSNGQQGEDNIGYLAVFYGSSEPDTIADIVLWGEEPYAGLGLSVVGIDFDQDGQKDIVVGSHRDYPPTISPPFTSIWCQPVWARHRTTFSPIRGISIILPGKGFWALI